MSGRKYSQVELANNVREAIRCRLAAEESLARAETIVAALAEAMQTTPALAAAVVSARETLAQIRQQLESMTETFAPSQLMQLTLARVQAQRQRIELLQTQLEQIAQQGRAGSQAATHRAELAAMLDRLQKDRDELEPWLRDVYASFTSETCTLLEHADQEIRASETLDATVARILHQLAQYDAMIGRAGERRARDRERRYVAAALEQVCREMAFAPQLLPQASLLEDLVLEVETYAYGVIHFRLQLDGTIRSQSELVETSCCANFAMIEDKLRALGVLSGFRYEGDQRPVRLQKGEKSLSDSEPGATMQETL